MNITWNPLGGRHSHVIGLRIPPQRSRLANQKVRRSCDRAGNEVIEVNRRRSTTILAVHPL